MLRQVAGMVKPIAAWTGKKSMWAGLVAFIGWSCIEMYDGAHERLQTRYGQAKDVVVPPVESTYEKVSDLSSKFLTSLEANPGPTVMAVVLFIFTIVYHRAHGRGLKEAFVQTVLRTAPTEPKKPRILSKAENEILLEKLVSSEAILIAKIENLPHQIRKASGEVVSATINAGRSRELALRDQAAHAAAEAEHKRLSDELDEAKQDLIEVREQLGKEKSA